MNNKTKDFSQQMLENFLPKLKILVEKEQAHLQWLKDNNANQNMIFKSQSFLEYYEMRLNQYQEYTLKNW